MTAPVYTVWMRRYDDPVMRSAPFRVSHQPVEVSIIERVPISEAYTALLSARVAVICANASDEGALFRGYPDIWIGPAE